MLPYNGNLKQYSRQLRENMTDAERRLWASVRMKQLKRYQFYRQKPIGDYIVDFFCPGAKLVIEIDGSYHLMGETIEYDRIRDDYLSSLGLRVLRFTNSEVLTDIEGVVKRIREEMEGEIPFSPEKIPLSPPFSKGETGVPCPPSQKRGRIAGKIPLSPPFSKGETVTPPYVRRET
jgi:very-short-patch-repair endonuclease